MSAEEIRATILAEFPNISPRKLETLVDLVAKRLVTLNRASIPVEDNLDTVSLSSGPDLSLNYKKDLSMSAERETLLFYCGIYDTWLVIDTDWDHSHEMIYFAMRTEMTFIGVL